MKKKVAVFFDRDGTLMGDVGWLSDMEKISIYPEAFKAVKMLNNKGIKVIVVTNQSGIARGFFDESFVEAVHERIAEIMESEGAHIDRFYFCPHHPTEGQEEYRKKCNCRKPAAGMLLDAANDFRIDLTKSFVIGDNITDIEMAHNVGAIGILVKTGHGTHHCKKVERVEENVLTATKAVLRELSL